MKRNMLGYSIEMHYVGVDSADTAKLRVKNRGFIRCQSPLRKSYNYEKIFRNIVIYNYQVSDTLTTR